MNSQGNFDFHFSDKDADIFHGFLWREKGSHETKVEISRNIGKE